MMQEHVKAHNRGRAQDALFALISETGWSLPEIQTRMPVSVQHNHLWNVAVAAKTPSEAMVTAIEGMRISYALPKRMFGREFPPAMRLIREAALMKKPRAERVRDALDIWRMIHVQGVPEVQLPWAWFILATVLDMADDADLARQTCTPEHAWMESERTMDPDVDYGDLVSILRVNHTTYAVLRKWRRLMEKAPKDQQEFHRLWSSLAPAHQCHEWFETFHQAAVATNYQPFYLDAIEIAIICRWEKEIHDCVQGLVQGHKGRPASWIGYWINARLSILGAPNYILQHWVGSAARKVLINLDGG